MVRSGRCSTKSSSSHYCGSQFWPERLIQQLTKLDYCSDVSKPTFQSIYVCIYMFYHTFKSMNPFFPPMALIFLMHQDTVWNCLRAYLPTQTQRMPHLFASNSHVGFQHHHVWTPLWNIPLTRAQSTPHIPHSSPVATVFPPRSEISKPYRRLGLPCPTPSYPWLQKALEATKSSWHTVEQVKQFIKTKKIYRYFSPIRTPGNSSLLGKH